MSIPTPAAFKARLDEKKISDSSSLDTKNRSTKTSRRPSKSTSTSSTQKPSKSSQDKKRVSSREASATTESSQSKTSIEKKPFERPEHLNQRPLRFHTGLLELKNALTAEQSKNNKENN